MKKRIAAFFIIISTISMLGIVYASHSIRFKEDVAKVKLAKWTTITNSYEKVIRRGASWNMTSGKIFNVKCKIKEHGTTYCFCKSSDYTTCQRCPVSDTWCEYDYYDWQIIESLELSGTNYIPEWPSIIVVGNNQKLEETIRFKVVFETSEEKIKVYIPENIDELKKFISEDWWQIKFDTENKIKPIKIIEEGVNHKGE